MTDILFSSLVDGANVSFNPATDRIIIDGPAADVDLESSTGSSFRIAFFGKRVTFSASVTEVVGGPGGNLITANNSVWVIGDNEPSILDPNPSSSDDGPNIIQGSNADDYLSGFGGNDTIYGGDGRDALIGGAGNDFLDGGDGDDFAWFSGAVYANLLLHQVSTSTGEVDQIYNVEQIWASASYRNDQNAFADIMIGDDANNYFSSYAGNDVLEGNGGDDAFRAGAGQDSIDGGSGFDDLAYHDSGALQGITIDLGNGSGSLIDAWGDVDTFTSIEAVRGTKFADTITGSNEANRFRGFAGNDIIDGRDGNDWIDYSQEASDYTNRTGLDAGVTVNLQLGVATDPFGNTDQLTSIEGAIGGHDSDTIIGSLGGNFRLDGLGGRDSITGLGGNDILDGGADDDWLDGGTGDDLLIGGDGLGDVAIFSGARASYSVRSNPDGSITILDKRAGGDGKDVVESVELFQFSDGAVALASLPAGNVNSAPVLSAAVADQTGTEEVPFTLTIPASAFSDSDLGDSLTLSVMRADGSALPSWISFNSATRTLSGTAPVNFNGTIDLKVVASDGQLSASDLFTLTVAPVNDAPVAQGESASVDEDASVSGNVLTNDIDVDGPALAVASVSGMGVSASGMIITGTYGMLTIRADGVYSYAADRADALTSGQVATDSFAYLVSDGSIFDDGVLTFTVTGWDEVVTPPPPPPPPIVTGTAGSDTIIGGVGNDRVSGGAGNDTLTGGRGPDSRDTFVFETKLKKNVDTLTDFESAYDQIFLDDAVFKGLSKGTPEGTPLKKGMFEANKHGEATSEGAAQIVYETDTGKLFYDVDGEGGKDAVQFAVLSGKPKLALADFEII